jgi:hypothetical protein
MRVDDLMSLEITNDARSERFRDLVARAFLEILGPELQYGPWTVILRSDRDTLRVVMTGPRHTHQEWAFDIAGVAGPAEMADQFRRHPWKRK